MTLPPTPCATGPNSALRQRPTQHRTCPASSHDAAASPNPAAHPDPAASPDHDAAVPTDDAAASPSQAHEAEDTVAAARRRNADAERVPARRADALVAMAETVLSHGPAARDGGERYQVVLTVGHDSLAGTDGEVAARSTTARGCQRRHPGGWRATRAWWPSVAGGGEPLSVGRSTPTIPRHVRRALRKRDGGCCFPGCGQRRFVDGHHIVHRARGGETALDNLCLLCRLHHHAVHEGGFGLKRTPSGQLVFTTPAGDILAPPPRLGRWSSTLTR